jgi:hypothetical protein
MDQCLSNICCRGAISIDYFARAGALAGVFLLVAAAAALAPLQVVPDDRY